ncbi:MAG: hypothetical protein JO207_02675 [Verrucomicrobia bacterium]|nr:hypothetical protein [Verrucomicrobiota bacterium]
MPEKSYQPHSWRQAAPPTVKQHMAAIRMLFSWLTDRFKEKGGKEKELPVHHKLEELLDNTWKRPA